jgi:hypothetical protein
MPACLAGCTVQECVRLSVVYSFRTIQFYFHSTPKQMQFLSVILLRNKCSFLADFITPSPELHHSELGLALPRQVEGHWPLLVDLLRHLPVTHFRHLQMAVQSLQAELLEDLMADLLACPVSRISGL